MPAQPNTAVGGPITQVQEQNPGSGIPFRRATTFRTSRLQSTTKTLTTSGQQVDEVLEGSGYIYGIDLHVYATTASNSANTTFDEDAPFSAISSVVFRDVNGELVNITGYHLKLTNWYAGYTGNVRDDSTSQDTNYLYNTVTGTGGTGGSFRFHLWIPVGLNRRDLRGVLGNQDRAQKYSLRSDVAASGDIYGTAPTTLSDIVIERAYHNYAVPAIRNANNAGQAQYPEDFGILHYTTQSVNPSGPIPSSTQNHYLARLGNTIRMIILVFRENGLRSDAEDAMPTQIQFNVGDTPLFVETVAARRWLMWTRYGFATDTHTKGVLVYDFLSDIVTHAGDELGVDYLYTNGLVNAQFQITYPSGFAAAGSTLTVLTDDLVIPPHVNIYA